MRASEATNYTSELCMKGLNIPPINSNRRSKIDILIDCESATSLSEGV